MGLCSIVQATNRPISIWATTSLGQIHHYNVGPRVSIQSLYQYPSIFNAQILEYNDLFTPYDKALSQDILQDQLFPSSEFPCQIQI